MLGGIGARGGKKDRKQVLKNKIRNEKRERNQLEEKEKNLEKEKLEKKKKIVLEKPIQEESNLISKKKEVILDPQVRDQIDEIKKRGLIPPKIEIASEPKLTKIEESPKEKYPIGNALKEERFEDLIPLNQKTEEHTGKKGTDVEIVPFPPFTPREMDSSLEVSLEEPQIRSSLEDDSIVEEEKKGPTVPYIEVKEPKSDLKELDFHQLEQERLEEQRQEQEDLLELKVAMELERLLKNNRFELKKLYTDLETIERESDSLYQVSDTEDAIDEIERLLDYLAQIKRQLEVISKSHNLDSIYQLDDSYFSHLVQEYKAYVKDQQVIEDKMKDFKRGEEYTSLVKKILEFEQMQEELTNTLEDKKQELEARDQNFALLQDQYLDMEKVSKELESLIYDSERHLEKITQKVNEAVDITTKAEIKMKYTMGVLARTLLLFSLMKMNPKPKANAVTAVETVVAVDLIRKLLTPKMEKRMVTRYHYTDYQSMIENALSDIYSISSFIETGIKDVKDLKRTFEEEFSEYANLLPEYKELLASITKIEKELEEREDHMRHVKAEMQMQLNKNNQKVLEYERLNQENY